MIKVLFVCLGNICRSPTAHGVLERKLALDNQNLEDLMAIITAGNVKTSPVLFLGSFLQFPSEVPDPYYGGKGGFEAVLDMIENACDQLILDIRSKI
jgi:protein-tyrosine phosphatase